MYSSMFSTHALNGTTMALKQCKIYNDSKKSAFLHKHHMLHNKSNRVSANQIVCNSGRLLSKERIQPMTLDLESIRTMTGDKFQLHDVIEAQQFDRDILSAIFEVAREMETIEKTSLGSQILNDTIRTVEGYSDIIVIRHFEGGAAQRAARTANIPVINAGDGPGQHPTQALLDMYTIKREIGKLDGITVGLVGDLANGRTARSLAYLLAKYNDVKIYLVSPSVVKMKEDIKEYLTLKGVDWEECADLKEVASKCDVVYQTRIQKERFGERTDLYEQARGKYIVDKGVLDVMQKHSIIMHPLPRLDEITVDVDDDPRAAYFRQAKNGLFIRMALLKLLLLGW
ncbi:hypothetical protein R6Q57_018237 [Mikania cordata]